MSRNKSFVQRAVANQVAQVGLCQRGAGIAEILNFILRLYRIDHLVIDDCVHFHGHVVLGDQLLRRHGDYLLAHIHAHNVVHKRDDERKARLRHGVIFAETRY
jgi:hypothetical protein